MNADNSAWGSGLCRWYLPDTPPPLGHAVKIRRAFHYRTKYWTKSQQNKTKHTRMSKRTNKPIILQIENIKEVEEFTYLGSKMTADGRSERKYAQDCRKLTTTCFNSFRTNAFAKYSRYSGLTPSPMQNSTEEHQPSPSHWR